MLEHRAVVEQQMGRFLYPTEVVHHRNHVRSDNDPDNLQVVINQYVHMMLDHSSLNDSSLVQTVLEAAGDPNISLADLPCAPATARRICSHFQVEWVSAAHSNLDYDEVKRQLAKCDNLTAAVNLGVSVSTLRRNYPELFPITRPRPGFLEKHKEPILRLRASGKSYQQIAEIYGTNKVTVGAALRRWEANKPMLLGRKAMNFLDEHREAVVGMLRIGKSMSLIGKAFSTSPTVVREQLYRWQHSGELPADIIELLLSRMRRKRKPKQAGSLH